MKNPDDASTLATEPIDGAGAEGQTPAPQAAAPRKRKKVSDLSKAFANQDITTNFEEGDSVLLKVKHLHGYHATITAVLDNDQFVVRVNEGNAEGALFQFSSDQLEVLDHPHDLKKHQNDRLEWNYKS